MRPSTTRRLRLETIEARRDWKNRGLEPELITIGPNAQPLMDSSWIRADPIAK
jgi:hypothetical protein